jgi:hypothetical protein
MTTFDPLDYVLDLGDRHNCSCIENAEPGKPMGVLVRPEQDPSGPTLKATLNRDGAHYTVTVTTPDGQTGSFGGYWKELLLKDWDNKPAA